MDHVNQCRSVILTFFDFWKNFLKLKDDLFMEKNTVAKFKIDQFINEQKHMMNIDLDLEAIEKSMSDCENLITAK
jgi:hypothetical protein